MPTRFVVLLLLDTQGNSTTFTLSEGIHLLGREKSSDLFCPAPSMLPNQGMFRVTQQEVTYRQIYPYEPWFLNGHEIVNMGYNLQEDDCCCIGGVQILVKEISWKMTYWEVLVDQWFVIRQQIFEGSYQPLRIWLKGVGILLFLVGLGLGLQPWITTQISHKKNPGTSYHHPSKAESEHQFKISVPKTPNARQFKPAISNLEKQLQSFIQYYSNSKMPYFFPSDFVRDVEKSPEQKTAQVFPELQKLLIELLKNECSAVSIGLENRVQSRLDEYRRLIGLETPDQVLLVIMGVYLAECEQEPKEIFRILGIYKGDPQVQRNVWFLFEKKLLPPKGYHFLVRFFVVGLSR